MPAVAATIAVTWDSNYAGAHRVCFRVQGTIPYTCTTAGTHPICAGGGAPCAYNINVLVDQETCDTVIWEGYVQAACEDESSLVGRIPFTATFVPDPQYKQWDVSCDGVPILGFGAFAGGTGYSVGDPVVILDAQGVGATAEVGAETAGTITAFTLLTPGDGYVAPTLDCTGSGDGNATGSLTLDDCAAFALVGSNAGPHQSATLALSDTIEVCASTEPTTSTYMSATENGDCICQPCYTITVNNPTGGALDASWLDCSDSEVKTQSIAAAAVAETLGSTCTIITGSLVLESGLVLNSSVVCP